MGVPPACNVPRPAILAKRPAHCVSLVYVRVAISKIISCAECVVSFDPTSPTTTLSLQHRYEMRPAVTQSSGEIVVYDYISPFYSTIVPSLSASVFKVT